MAEMNDYDMEPDKGSSGEGQTRRRGCCGMDMDYVKSVYGALKGNQIGWTTLAFVLSWFCGLAIVPILFAIAMCCSLLVTIGVFCVFAFHLEKKFKRLREINFYLVDFLLSIVATVVYFALSLPMVIFSGAAPLFIIAGVAGFLGMAAYFGNILFSFKRWRSSVSRAAAESNQPYDTNQ